MSAQEQDYSWFTRQPTWTNTSSRWVVLIGCTHTALEADTDTLNVLDSTGTNIDSFELEVFGAAATELLAGLPRRMLVPPGGQITCSNSPSLSLILCGGGSPAASLKLALAIL